MPRPELHPRNWERRHKHRKATHRNWDEAKEFSGEGDSQYHPDFDDAEVERMENECIDEGVCYNDSGHCKKFYKKMDRIVGVCCGIETDYLFAEWTSGTVHGRPISIKRLEDMGASV